MLVKIAYDEALFAGARAMVALVFFPAELFFFFLRGGGNRNAADYAVY
jgi:hypothetical protein